MPPSARVWVYQSGREFTDPEVQEILQAGDAFTNSWKAHGSILKATFALFYKRFIVFCVDESQHQASGCSIDKTYHFIRDMEQRHSVKLFDRMTLAYRHGSEILTTPLHDIRQSFLDGTLSKSSAVFDNTVATVGDMRQRWEVTLEESVFMQWLDPLEV